MNCISCGKSVFTLYVEDSYLSLPVFYCNNCGLYVCGNSEQIRKEKSIGMYGGKYWNERDTEKSLTTNFVDSNSKSKRRQWLSQFYYCKRYLENKKDLLEIGSGAGRAICWFDELGYAVTGLEPDARNVELINQKLTHGKCIQGYVDEAKIDGKFDIVWISHVLEHLIRPDTILERLSKNIKKDGILFLEVPNCENRNILENSIHGQPHTYHFSKRSLELLVERVGYKVEQCDFFRPPTMLEGAINKISKKYLSFMRLNIYPYYPRIIAKNNNGVDTRMILRINA
jgi:2-polyprenyl-3-methyl-5-hydroxy-6-metoxy-1,4-benzoquinol methylase